LFIIKKEKGLYLNKP